MNDPAPLMLSVSGCRGIVGESLTPDVVSRYVAAAVDWVRHERAVTEAAIVVSRDGRAGGEPIKRHAIAALLAAGCRVIDIDVATTPTCGVMVLHHRADAGLQITASHNPAQWNGIKIITGEGTAPNSANANAIIARFRASTTALSGAGAGSVAFDAAQPIAPDAARGITEDPASAKLHVDRVLAAVAELVPLEGVRARQFPVVLNSVNASGRIGGRLLLDALGCRLTHLNADTSGVFPHPPEPTAENLRAMCDETRHAGAVVGFAQDPDADRLALIDERGVYIGEEYTLVLAALSLLSAMRPADASRVVLAANLSTSRMIDDVAAMFGARVVRTAVGEANVVDGMIREHAVLGGEGNGGVIWPRIVPIRDSLGAMALVLALMTRSGKGLSELAASVPSYAIEKRKLETRPGLAQQAVRAVRALYAPRGATLDEQDGLRADFDAPGPAGGRAWLHVRASNTEPIVRFIAEAPTAAAANAILDEAQRAASPERQ